VAGQSGWNLNQPLIGLWEHLKTYFRSVPALLLCALLVLFALWINVAGAQPAREAANANDVRLVEVVNAVEVSPKGATTWVLTQTNQVLHAGDRLRTGANSKAVLLWSDSSVATFGPATELEVLPPHAAGAQSGLNLAQGILSFFHRDKPGRIRVITRGGVAGIEGTEFVMEAGQPGNPNGVRLSVIDGLVQFTNESGALVLTNGQQAIAEPGKAPTRTAGFIANNLLQWCFYYPAVLDVSDLSLASDEQSALADSLAAYRTGDLPHALANYPATRQPASDTERLYYAALMLGVGQAGSAETTLASLSDRDAAGRVQRVANALRLLISAVKRETVSPLPTPQLASELLARSYYEQSRAIPGVSLQAARGFARQAVTNAPQSGYAWARLAELEFGFGQTDAAMTALAKSLALAPRNAEAMALQGFVFAYRNQTTEAMAAFNRALAADANLGNAWLGRGLTRIHRGDAAGGREDLLVAAALEPQRGELRSYLAKAYANSNDYQHARKELQLAQGLDPNDPTAWLYLALLNQSGNRINEGISDLEKSEELNDNRSVYRSQLMLDQDQAVRGANLASLYKDAGMVDIGVQEAGHAISYDYANYSAHLFLANSYDALRDPNQINLRYETPAETEYLLAELLSPVAAGPMTQITSQQQYSPLFERDRFGLVSSTEYLSRGAWTQNGAQYGVLGNFGYDVEAQYRTDPGQRPNNDIEQRQLSGSFKEQITPQDTVYLRVVDYKADSGDTAQYYDPAMANTTLRVTETQDPNIIAGYHHEWEPGVHTLFLFARLQDTYSVSVLNQFVPIADVPDGHAITAIVPGIVDTAASLSQEIYSAELQQIWQQPTHNTIAGVRYQWGGFHMRNLQNPDSSGAGDNVNTLLDTPAADQDFSSDFHRLSLYGYHYWQVADPLLLVGGLSYDFLRLPENFQSTPFGAGQKDVDQFSPKAGLVWTPTRNTTIRAAYTRSLGGASLDQSYRLEPTEVAGLNQAFRSIIPESVTGANAGAQFKTYGLSLEQRFDTRTYLGVSGGLLYSKVSRFVGAYGLFETNFNFAAPSGLNQDLNYREATVVMTADQLLGKEWTVGVRYGFTDAHLDNNFVDVPDSAFLEDFTPQGKVKSALHQINLHANWNHPSGLFATLEGVWYSQNNTGFTPAEPGDDFWQFNALAGYRFPRRRAEAALGVLNIADRDYRLEPLTLYNEMPRTRTLVARLQFNF
jgi:Flp pilus assembly protein TadD